MFILYLTFLLQILIKSQNYTCGRDKNEFIGIVKDIEENVRNFKSVFIYKFNYTNVSENDKVINEVYFNGTKVRKTYVLRINQNRYNSRFNLNDVLFIIICPKRNIKKFFYLYSSIEKFERPGRCSILRCDIGFYFYVNKVKNEVIGFYIGFFNDNKNAEIIFDNDDIQYNQHFNIPLVTCPYYNWIDNLNYTYFKPHYFNKNNGPKQNHNKLTKHILVPAFPTSVDKRNIFICGYIYQKFLPIVKVGYKLYNSKPYNLSEVKISDKYIECNGVNVTNEYIYVYDQENIFFNSVIFIEKLKLLYSRDYIIVYNKEQIYEAYYEYLKFIKDLPNDQIQNFLEIGKTYFSPSCVGQVNNIPATLKLKFDSDSFVKEIKDITSSNISKTYIIIVDNLKLNKSKVNVGCIAVPDYLNDSKFDSFYNNRFQINLYKGRLNRYYRESLITSIDFSSLPENIYGIYSCSFKYMIYFRPVNFTEYIILPVNQIHLQKFIETITDNEVDIFCNKTFNEIGDLVEMIITTNFGLIYSNFYNKSKFENSNDGLFFLTDNINEVNGANVKCIYKFQGMNYLTLEKEISVIVSPKLSIRWLSWLNSPYTKIGTSFFGVIFGILMLIAFLKWSINRKLIKNEKSFDEEEMTSEESSKINTHS